MTDDVPYLAVGNDELGDPVGEYALCPRCKRERPVQYGKELIDGKFVPSKLLAYVQCCDNTFLVGIKGRIIK